MRFKLVIFCCTIFCVIVCGQAKANKSVNQTNDSLKIISLVQQASKYISNNVDSGIYFGELALKISLRAKQYEHLNELHRIVGWCYYHQQNFKKAQMHLQFALNDSTLNNYERNKIYEALLISSENNGDYQHAYLYLKTIAQFKDSVNQQKQTDTLSKLQIQLDANMQLKKDAILKMQQLEKKVDEREYQLKTIFFSIVIFFLLVICFLGYLLYYNNGKFKTAIAEKNSAIAQITRQLHDLQNETTELQQLQNEIEIEHREKRKEELATEEIHSEISETKAQTISLLDQYQNTTDDERKKIIPTLKLFHQNIPNLLQQIEQAFSRHDWNKINETLQSIKPFVKSLVMQKEESLINEINEHVNANATNRAVVKVLQVKSSCLKTIGAIENILK